MRSRAAVRGEAGKATYEPVHRLSRNGRLAAALRVMHEPSTGRVRGEFSDDLNHAWYVIGDIHYRQQETRAALHAFKRALHHWPGDAEAMMAIGNCYADLRMPRWSAWYLAKASELRPKDAAILFNLGNAYFDQGKKSDARRAYAKAAKHADGPLLESIKLNACK